MPMTTEDLMTQRRSDSTAAERTVLALEDIAAHLQGLVSSFQCSRAHCPKDEAESASLDNWENEGGDLGTKTEIPPGIERGQSEFFLVGPYRYTSLNDAIAQLRRQQVAERKQAG